MGAGYSAFASEHLFILLDKSGSMWAREQESKRPVFEVAKERIYDLLNNIPPEPGRRRVTIILFDSRLKTSFSQEIINIEKAKEFLEQHNPGGKTTIGDRLDEVRQQIIGGGLKSVELHLFSDLKETLPGKIPFKDAVKKLNTFLAGDLKDIEWTLYCYTWSAVTDKGDEYDVVTTKNVRKNLPLRNVIPTPINKVPLRALIHPPDPFVVNLKDREGKIVDMSDGDTRIRGLIAPRLLSKNITMKVRASCEDIPGSNILINGMDEFDLTQYADRTTGKFDIKNVKISFRNAKERLEQMDDAFFKQPHLMYFEPVLNLLKVADLQKAFLPQTTKTSFYFASDAFLYIKNYPVGKKFFRKGLFEGATIREPIELAWNYGAVGKTVILEERPRIGNSIGYFTTPGGNDEVELPFRLSDLLSRTIVFRMDKIKTIQNQKIAFRIQGTPAKAEIPFNVQTLPPSVAISFKTSDIQIPLTGSSHEIQDAALIEPVATGLSLNVEFLLKGCKGEGCKDVNFTIIDPFDPGFKISLNGAIVNSTITSPKWLNYKIKANTYGDSTVKLLVRVKDGIIQHDGKSLSKFSHQIQLHMVSPKLEWEIAHNKTGKKLGASNKTSLGFISKGEDVTTNDKGLFDRGFAVKSTINTNVEEITGLTIKVVCFSKPGTSNQLVKQVIFNATGKSRCRIAQFLQNPHVTLIVDEEKKPWVGRKKESGKICLELESQSKGIDVEMPLLYYRLKLMP